MLEIKTARCLLVLEEAELRRLLAHEPELWKKAIRRGKAVLRARRNANRLAKGAAEEGCEKELTTDAKGAQKGGKREADLRSDCP